MRSTIYRQALMGLAAATMVTAGCSKDDTGPNDRFPAGAAAFSGDAQTAPPATPLADPLTVKVFDDQGAPFAGVVVTWAVTAGGGQLDVSTSTTGDDGIATAHWTLGPTPGENTATATVPDVQTVVFSATAEPATAPPHRP